MQLQPREVQQNSKDDSMKYLLKCTHSRKMNHERIHINKNELDRGFTRTKILLEPRLGIFSLHYVSRCIKINRI